MPEDHEENKVGKEVKHGSTDRACGKENLPAETSEEEAVTVFTLVRTCLTVGMSL